MSGGAGGMGIGGGCYMGNTSSNVSVDMKEYRIDMLEKKIRNRDNSVSDLKDFIEYANSWCAGVGWWLTWDDYERGLQLSAELGRLDFVTYFVDLEIPIDGNDGHAIRWAAYNGHDVVRYLVSKGASIDCLTPDLRIKYSLS
jgi:hypothetical protein